MLSSLPLQILLFFNTIYVFVWAAAMLLLFAWKRELRHYFGLEVTLVFVMFVCELARLFVGSRGNKLEQMRTLLLFVILTLPVALGSVYYLYLQIFVTRADLVLNAVSVAFEALELLLAIPTLMTFRHAGKAGGAG
ncbi:hypothetical protein EMIHUDRAFT_222967 [Emiliania huxleyi CCMP1516]|uniref:Transmembrane protein 216 n=2 Tax=Emiliania huxleyi TaxID=2903 RepID=A0A0D3KWI6_EMIH1|nr:hypothetical protein EMIHUDRAFT_222967 [Emiliania huxleyi CCMP1516]EOD40121.1 hypothetical protein EMIHUDRAFT_222967 [Emiliania huxleyi CCMP1516]|eukprot:XP_005792550.1 hypothetical protein EMIHUDRAFT_222967 [Emiliania huxleyi CCMP1516]